MSVLSIKPWQLFIILTFPMMAAEELSWQASNVVVIVVSIFSYFLIFFWYALLASELNKRLKNTKPVKYWTFIFSCCYVFVSLSLSSVWFVYGSIYSMENVPLHRIVLVILFIISYGNVIYHTGNLLLNYAGNELISRFGERAYALTFVFLWVFPIGVWFIQPVINRQKFTEKVP